MFARPTFRGLLGWRVRKTSSGFQQPKSSSAYYYSTHRTATFEVDTPYKLHRLDEGPSKLCTVEEGEALKMLRQMMTMRKLETSAGKLYKEKIIRGFCHLYAGEEACAVGIRSELKDIDSVIVSFRDHAWAYLMGIPVYKVLAELTGERVGTERGRGGSMHFFTKNFYGGNGIVGAQVPLGGGLALAHKYKGDGGVAVTTYGDGAANQGQVYETFNMAKLWKLPLIFVCENNHYAMGTSVERGSANPNFYTRGDLIPGIWVDGMDVLAVREATRFARDFVSKGNGPIILECVTYRFYPHSMVDPDNTYRPHEEIELMRRTKDPIKLLKNKMISTGLADEDELKEIEDMVTEEVNAATEIAKAHLEPGPEELAADIYALNLEGPIRGVTSYDTLEHKNIGSRVNMK